MRILSTLAMAALGLALVACTQGARSRSRSGLRDAERREPPPPRAPVVHEGTIPGTPSIRVVWEALSVERELLANPRFRRPRTDSFGGTPDLEVILVNASFVASAEQAAEHRQGPATGRVARVTDQEMIDLLAAFAKMGFYEHAQPTGSVRRLFASDRARGRITVDHGDRSVTLLSERGLGLQDATKAIPGIYAQAKAAINVLRNRTPTLRVSTVKKEPVGRLPPGAASGGGK